MLCMSIVWPSGAAFATMSAPIVPPAPPRLSTSTCWPIDSPMRCATSRATTSVVPPAGKGTTIRSGRAGKAGSAAWRTLDASASAASETARTNVPVIAMRSPPLKSRVLSVRYAPPPGTSPVPLISLDRASLAFGDAALLDHADLVLDAGERVALIGRNGTGKTSLLKVIAGQQALDDGAVWRAPGLRVAFVPQEPQLEAQHTVYEAVAMGLG